ncbi:aspartic peptidase domain-containing protein [Radiomyces spectabilis]|uniref:aspartic peptidase domain-containing protein n=1 Tax=Radiomyces spectabilis TaxID=64574 RepID=UPI00221FA99A|nr:aspartic peptidase domain-containing protein [Radiomyces spectabilis]KAI8390986.1 aspartic peptidase domain-containing protein [Radiomyces spectabilis]
MRLIAIASVIALVISATNAASLPPPQKNGFIRLPLQRVPTTGVTGVHRSALLKRDKTTVPLLNEWGREYVIEVGIGTPPQKFNVTLDTGSFDLWVPSSDCSSIICPYKRFDHAKSSTYKPTSQPFEITYGIGEATGTYALDTITVGTLSQANQPIGLAKYTKDILGVSSDQQSNGILGLGFPVPGITMPNTTTFMFSLVENNAITEPVFSIYLGSRYKFGYGGEMIIGGVDTTKFTGQLTYVPVVSYDLSGYAATANLNSRANAAGGIYAYWTAPGQGISIVTQDGQTAGFNQQFTQLEPFILDTGTTLTYGPKTITDAIVKEFTKNSKTPTRFDPLNSAYAVGCDVAQQTNKMEFTFSTSSSQPSKTPVKITVTAKELVIPVDSDILATAKQCYFGIAPMLAGTDVDWIIGESVLRSAYQVYDMKNHRVGIAPATGLDIVSDPSEARSSIPVDPARPTDHARPTPGVSVPASAAVFLSASWSAATMVAVLVTSLVYNFQ